MERGFYVQAKESAANARARRAQPSRRCRNRRLQPQQVGRQRMRKVSQGVRVWRRRAESNVGGRHGRAVRESAKEEGRVTLPNRCPRTVERKSKNRSSHSSSCGRSTARRRPRVSFPNPTRSSARSLPRALNRRHDGTLHSRGKTEGVRRLGVTSK